MAARAKRPVAKPKATTKSARPTSKTAAKLKAKSATKPTTKDAAKSKATTKGATKPNATSKGATKPSATKSKATTTKGAATTQRPVVSKELAAYLRAWKEYPITEIRGARCTCGKAVFAVIDAGDAGGAKRICIACKREHLICDSAEYWDEADPGECACPCGEEAFEVAAGFAFYAESTDVRWIYLGLRCVACKQSGVYVDWKIDYGPSHQLVDQV